MSKKGLLGLIIITLISLGIGGGVGWVLSGNYQIYKCVIAGVLIAICTWSSVIVLIMFITIMREVNT
jgi:hypothetical protein